MERAILGLFLIVIVFATGAGAASWTHSMLDGYDVWYLNGTSQKFRYNLTNQQWSHFSDIGSSWYTISSTGRSNTFIGDGAWYDMGNGFKYQYSDGYDKGTFKDGLKDRLLYKYGTGQWWHVGDTTHSWQVLGTGGHNGTFIGSGSWYDLGNGFTYKYSIDSDKGTFKDGSAYRFLYNYASGQWYHSADTLSWQALGKAGLTAAFLGSGAWYDLGNGFDYQFSRGYHKGTFSDSVARFLYKYDRNQWLQGDYLGTKTYVLSAVELSASFVGDGRWRDLGNGWNFKYDVAAHFATYTDGYAWFGHLYGARIWLHRGQGNPEWCDLGYYSPWFIGDGHSHALNNDPSGWWFQYSRAYHKGTFRLCDFPEGTTNDPSFLYKYHTCQWWHYTTAWEPLSAEGVGSFWSDTSEHDGGPTHLGYINGAYWNYDLDFVDNDFIGYFSRSVGSEFGPYTPYSYYNYDTHEYTYY